MPETPTTVIVADPHPRQRQEICRLLDGDPRLQVMAVTAHRHAAAELCGMLAPDVAVIDVALLAASGFALREWPPISRAVALVAVGLCDDAHLDAQLRRAGFADYVAAERFAADLGDAVAHAARRHVVA